MNKSDIGAVTESIEKQHTLISVTSSDYRTDLNIHILVYVHHEFSIKRKYLKSTLIS